MKTNRLLLPGTLLHQLLYISFFLSMIGKVNGIVCPAIGSDPKEVIVPKKKKVFRRSVPGTLCTLVHVQHADPTQTSDITITNNSLGADYTITPMARSYNANPWERVQGSFLRSIKVKKCTAKKCIMRINTPGKYFLMSYNHTLPSFDGVLSRFLMQSTFGPTRDMIVNWPYEEGVRGMAKWIRAQMDLPPTLHREYYRKYSDLVSNNNTAWDRSLTVQHPCDQYSRWRDYVFMDMDRGRDFDVVQIGGSYVIMLYGAPRTVLNSFSGTGSDGSTLSGAGEYELCYSINDIPGGYVDFRLRDTNDRCISIDGGNPTVVFTQSVLDLYGQLFRTIELPSKSANFETRDPIYIPDSGSDWKIMSTLRLTTPGGLYASNPTNCDILNNSYQYIIGKFSNGEYVHFTGNVDYLENTVENPLVDGGVRAANFEGRMCSNSAKNFVNIHSCFLAENDACQSSSYGRHFYDYAPQTKTNVVVCGSAGEVSSSKVLTTNDPQFFPWGHYHSQAHYGSVLQRKSVPYTIFMTAEDQFRQRMAFALSQILVVTPNQIDSDSREAEIFFHYYDIFTRHAFGNYRDILREVSYSPMMAEMLSYLDSSSASYVLLTEGRISRPDENYARELMQLFTIGLYKLKADGTRYQNQGTPIATYDNTDIQTFARAWTGFRRQYLRFNREGSYWMPNRIDPMDIEGRTRDPFPKLDLDGGFIGDGYPLCTELPSMHFLKKGATYRLIGSANNPDLQWENRWQNYTRVERFPLDSSNSQLYSTLCNADIFGNCVYKALVELDQNLDCHDAECNLENMLMVIVEPDVKYEYVRQPCVEFAFASDQDLNKISNRYKTTMCLNKKIDDIAMPACCVSENPSSWLSINADYFCSYSYEKSSYEGAQNRCENTFVENYPNPHTCDWRGVRAYANTQNPNAACGLYIHSNDPSWHWTNTTCSSMAKVNADGLVSIVHNPDMDDINTLLAGLNETLQTVYQPVHPENTNYFKVNWSGTDGFYPNSATNQCANNACVSMGSSCLCNIDIIESEAFTQMPTSDEVLSSLKIGHVAPDSFDDGSFNFVSTVDNVSLYQKTGNTQFSKHSIFGVEYRGKTTYFKNMLSIVQVSGSTGGVTYSYRNAPSFLNPAKPDIRDSMYETDAVIDYFFYHPNTAPFVAIRLIKRFGISNPSPRFVSAVSRAFTTGTYSKGKISFGDGNYGNLEATAAAIIADREARSVALDADPTAGSLREPLLKVLSFMRAMEYQRISNFPSVIMQGLQDFIGQEIHASPNVFSFFLDEYSPPGKVSNAALTAPEGQVLDAPKVIGMLNGLFSLVDLGLTSCFGGFADRNTWNCASYDRYTPEEMRSRGYLTFAVSNPLDGELVVEELAMLLTGGRLSSVSKTILAEIYTEEIIANGASAALKRVQKLFLTSPEFHSTNVYESTNAARLEAPRPQPSQRTYKAVVFLNLDGGFDSYNMLVPHSNCIGNTDMYNHYKNVRGDIALLKESLHTIDATGSEQVCNTFGLHESLPFLKSLYDANDLSFLANLGVLQQPVNKDNWRTSTTETSLFAHNTQQEEISFVDIYDEEAGRGVCGRMLDMLSLSGFKPGAISLNGIASSIRSASAPMVVIDSSGYQEINPTSKYTTSVVTDAKDMNTASTLRSSIYAETWSEALFQSLVENELMYEELTQAYVNATFPETDLGMQLSSLAKVMKTKDVRGTDRDIFNVRIGSFDHHIQIAEPLRERLETINDAIEAFVIEMRDYQNIWDDVTIVLTSEFARTLMANTGNGSDHAWGGNYFIASGSADGGKILGTFPSDLSNDGPDAFEPGIVIPTTPWESLWNGIAQWFGIASENDLSTVLPNRNTFAGNLWTMSDLYG